MPINQIVLLSGMNGTEKLLLDFSHALPRQMRRDILTYPRDRVLSYEDLLELVRPICAKSEPFVLLAESFSTPLAIWIAAERPGNLKGLVLCVGFAASPVRGLTRWLGWLLAPVLMRVGLPKPAIRSWLAGGGASEPLIATVRAALSSVLPNVLAARLRSILRCDVRSSLAQVNVPMLYLQARHDRLVKSPCLEEIQSLRPDIRTATLEGPHLLLLLKPQESARVVTEFIRSLEA